MVRSRFRGLVVLALPVALAACGSRSDGDRNLDTLDNELVDGNSANASRDPALMSALQDQIMVDPTLAQQANNDAVRPPAQPYSGAVPPDGIAVPPAGAAATTGAARSETLKKAPAPAADCPQCDAARESLTLGALAARQKDKRTSGCAGNMRYSARWAQRLPADLPLYPDARVSEAAGTEDGGCALRAVSFASSAPLQTVLDWYYTRATNAGYSAEHQADGSEHVLGGTRDRDDGAFALFLTSRADGGTDVDLVANNGN
ncbi:MAG: hypothetical protein JWN66_892 [Sphingomonas bacterium]|uniref:hypothetical protein n=1 Tax=Sphingomonas bacterium TaxID=1895847 RepID=UPI00261B8F4F|nr:hypothetical protein [Sphingomonas bacterium]MDB5703776.1 hypothetical protein [Sphingomonas bacterium]